MQPLLSDEEKRRLEEKNRQAQAGMQNAMSGIKGLFVPPSAPPPTNTSPEERARAQAMQAQVSAPAAPPAAAPAAPATAPQIKDDLQEGGAAAAVPPPQPQTPTDILAGFSKPIKTSSSVTTTQNNIDTTAAENSLRNATTLDQKALDQKQREEELALDEKTIELRRNSIMLNELEQRRADNLQAQEQAADTFRKQFDEYANTQVTNPWSNMSTGAKIMSAISIGLGGLGAGPGGKNIGLDIINQNIARDIDIQKANMDKKKGQLTVLQDYGQSLRAQGLNDQQVTEGMIALGKKLTANKLEQIALGMGSEDGRSSALLKSAADMNQDAAKTQLELAKAKSSTVTTTDNLQIGGIGGPGGGTGMGKDLSEKETSDLLNQQKALRGFKRLDNLAKANDDEIGLIMGTLNKYRAKFNAASGDFYKLDTATQDAIAKALKAQSGAQLTDKEIEWLKSYFPSTTMDSNQFRSRLAALSGPALEETRRELEMRAKLGQRVQPLIDQLNADFPTNPTGLKKTN